MKTFLEQLSLWSSVIGALLLALHISVSGWAYIPFLFSNVATLFLLRDSNASKVLTWQVIFFIFVNLIGLVCWLV